MNIDKKKEDPDILQECFGRISNEVLPASFHADVMKRVEKEAAKRARRNEILGLIVVAFSSLLMIAVFLFVYAYWGGDTIFQLPTLNLTMFYFYIYIGVIGLLLLFADYKLRRIFYKDH